MALNPTLNVLSIVYKIGRGKTPYQVAQENGISIEKSDILTTNGRLFVNEESERSITIFIKNGLLPKLEAFVLWHELAHYFLHSKNTIKKEWEILYAEIEANTFAQIMMGDDETYDIMENSNEESFINCSRMVRAS